MSPQSKKRRKLDLANLALMLVGLGFGTYAFWLVHTSNLPALIVIPSVVATTIGASRLTKTEVIIESSQENEDGPRGSGGCSTSAGLAAGATRGVGVAQRLTRR